MPLNLSDEPGPSAVDLDEESRRALEFDELLDWVADFARTPLGGRRLRALHPSRDFETVRGELAGVAEVRQCLRERSHLVPGRLPDVTQAIDTLRVEGTRLEGKSLRDLASVLKATGTLRSAVQGLAGEEYPRLNRLVPDLPDLREPSEPVLRRTDLEGQILDGASPELRRLRGQVTRAGERLRRLLHGYLKDPGSQASIRDDFVTQRNGRFVIPVRTDAPRPIRGIVHASSSSGATRFVEPLESVEPNNELVRLIEEEREEQGRILAAWTDAFRDRLPEVEQALSTLARIDGMQARALFSEACDAVVPQVLPGGPLRLTGMRHPLLHRRLSAEGGAVVPSSLRLDPADQVLVLSGPNTGGKTVALKSVGLMVLMAQSGIPVPAQEAELPLFGQVRADIGDHQSIQADLSTYSAHVRAVVELTRDPAPPALYLFDELGTGTEPTEGAALAQAILESLRAPGITVIGTTHLAPLKAWAITADGATCAAMELDLATFRPTYRIVMGVAGGSAGLEIAEHLGLDRTIVDRARSLIDPQSRKGEDYLRRLMEALSEAETTAEAARRELGELEEQRRQWTSRRSHETDSRRGEAQRALARVLEEFRRSARKELSRIRDAPERARAERRWSKAERRLEIERSRRRDEVAPYDRPEAAGRPVTVEQVTPGTRVFVTSLGREGEVLELEGREADVQLGRVVFRVSVDDLRVAASLEPQESGRAGTARQGPHEGSVEVRLPVAPRACPRELVLVGQRVADALAELDRFLDAARVAGHGEVRIVHGHGSGRLRKAVREFVSGHVHVRTHRGGRAEEGGEAATVVSLL